MVYPKKNAKSEFKKVRKKAGPVLRELEKLDFLDSIPHQLDGPRIPELYGRTIKPVPYTKGLIRRVL